MKDIERPLQLGMHTYTLHVNGLGESWGYEDIKDYEWRNKKAIDLMRLMDLAVEWELDGLHVTNVDLESLDPSHLAEVKTAAEAHGLYLEYNCAFDSVCDPRINSTVKDALRTAKAIGADLAKFSLDIRRPRPIYGSCFHPDVMSQLIKHYHEFKDAVPLMEELGVEVSLENHTETFADEVLWLVRQLNHPMIGACVDTINSWPVMESPEACIEKMAPYANCCHFCDNKIVIDSDGTHFVGVALGQGDIDCGKALQTLKEKSHLNRITFEVEYEMGDESIEVARANEIKQCTESIDYLRNVLKVGVRNR